MTGQSREGQELGTLTSDDAEGEDEEVDVRGEDADEEAERADERPQDRHEATPVLRLQDARDRPCNTMTSSVSLPARTCSN